MSTPAVHQDPAGFEARALQPSEFSDIAGLLAHEFDLAVRPAATVHIVDALNITSDGIMGNRILWLIESLSTGKIALAHSSTASAGLPHFDGLVWLPTTQRSERVPFSIPDSCLCSAREFCRRFLGNPFSSRGSTLPVSHR